MKKIIISCFFLLYPFLSVKAEYVLPYPSAMPGNKLYKLQNIIDTVKEYWSFGTIAKQRFYRSSADKFLVEAKTLFEYKQYLLATAALKKSDEQFAKVPFYLMNSYSEGKDISNEYEIYKEAATKHEEILSQSRSLLPDTFEWKPEKESSTDLLLGNDIKKSIQIRKDSVEQMELFFYCIKSISADSSPNKKGQSCKEEYESFRVPKQLEETQDFRLSPYSEMD